MAQEYPGDQQLLNDLSQLLGQHNSPAPKLPQVTDQDIFRAMIGKPIVMRDTRPQQLNLGR